MYKKCWGCNKTNVSVFAWLAGDNCCLHCKQYITDKNISDNWLNNSEEYASKISGRKDKARKQVEKIRPHIKKTATWIFGILALLWFVVMLPTQPDFREIVMGWLIIGVIYLFFRIKK